MSGGGADTATVTAEHRAFWVLLSLAAMGGALFACFVTFVWAQIGDAGVDSGGPGWLLVLALLGVPPTFVALALSIDGRGHPWRWLGASGGLYVVWYVIASGATA